MKRLLSLLAVVLTLGMSTVALDADAAKRMGSGKSMGTQRQSVDKAPTTPAAPAAAAAPAAGAAAGAAAAAPKRSWMGPLAGIAAGLGLAALASHFGFGDELASMVMMGLLAAAIMVAVGFFMRKRAAAKQASMGGASAMQAGGMQYAHAAAGAGAGAAPYAANEPAAVGTFKSALPAAATGGSMIGSGIGSNLGASVAPAAKIPADFDIAGFERNAKVNFVRLQAANDAGNLDDIRQFTTPEMFAEIKMELAERGTTAQKTDVLHMDAKVLEVEEDADRYLVSVRFTGMLRDTLASEPDEAFDEIWHLTKPRQGNGGWTLAGIQQAV